MIRFLPTELELTYLLPWAFGGTPSGSSFPLGDILSPYYVTVDRGTKVFTYNGCVVDTITFHGTQNQPLGVDLEVIGVDETVAAAGTFPSLALDVSTQPFIFMDLALVVNGNTYMCRQFELKIDNNIEKERFFNSLTLTAGYAKDRHVTLSHPLPFGDDYAAYNLGVGGVQETATFTNTAQSRTLTFSMVNVKYPRHSPRIEGHEEVFLPMQGTCYASGFTPAGPVTRELVTTLS